MIQRIQSLYLLLGAILMVALAFMNAAWQSVTIDFAWFNMGLNSIIIITVVTAVIAIIRYSNRIHQRNLTLLAQVLTLLTMVLLFGGLMIQGRLQVYTEDATLDTVKILAFVLPIAAYVLFYLARFAIQKDIKLVKSMDRLR